MHIGYDAKRAFLNNTGLGNYSRWLIKVMAQHYPEHTCFLYTPRVKTNSRLSFLNQFDNIRVLLPQGKLIKGWWRSKGIVDDLLRDGINLYHGLSHELPLGISQSGIKSVVTVHDLIFMRYPQQFGIISRKIYGLKVEKACQVANRIIAISKKTKNDIVELLHVDPQKIEVIYQGCDPVFNKVKSDEQKQAVSAKYNIPPRFLLNVGTIEERKNLLLLVKALKQVDNIPLVVIGRQKSYAKQVKQYLAANQLTARVIFLDKVDFNDLPAIYQMAPVFIYPSRYEGFGIPVLEALYSGVPVIAATGSCLEEAGGPHSLYTDPDDEHDLAKKINLVLKDEKLRQQMISEGIKYTAKFADDQLAGQLMKLYKNVYHA